ncbi:hypothetical protein AN639_11180 [Candidatus Epulonipiscium fishelsonii]|uniref:Uncharacterized protein n=1 Tax=Candidatus Epulonipiscium fishelsonii TaxID=77094 RepID=A0ACC8X981_9FIRM|nr:hypothetical protein AN396_10370 [Epulopiscium sp. SCG-B11WGA-EpuloA1]ONI43152.1 hypothetical protein AN639_11180 [Epulopiscium sp. SCG-B05WGA-EpuloA1]
MNKIITASLIVASLGMSSNVFAEEIMLSPFKNIEADIDCVNLEIIEGTEFKVEIEAGTKANGDVMYEVKDETLIVECDNTQKFKLFNFGFKKDNDIDITVHIPSKVAMENVNLSIGVGDSYLSGIEIQNFNVNTGVGDFEAKNITLYDAKIEVDVGDVELEGNIYDCEVNAGTGDIELKGDIAGEVTLDSGVGDIELESIRMYDEYDFNIEDGIGEIEINDAKITYIENSPNINEKYEINIKAGVGDISIETN